MGKLTDLLAAKLSDLQASRARAVSNHMRELAAVDAQIAQLQAASAVVTRQVEGAYDALLAMGLIQPVNR
jgi:hypothetical protein